MPRKNILTKRVRAESELSALTLFYGVKKR
jgi:hypothetical protein